MRRIISFLLILMAVAANARQISPDEAQSIASEFFGGSNGPKHVRAKGIKRVAPKDATADYQPYYIFNAADNAGFVIISGDDSFGPIVGYSDNISFDINRMPEQLKYMLDGIANDNSKSNVQFRKSPKFRASTTEGTKVIETALWGQGEPYNSTLPMMGDARPVTGCTATAMSIIMKHHGYPERGNKFLLCKDWNTQEEYTLDLANTEFKWDKMLTSYSENNYTEENAQAVGILMQCTGFTIGSSYSTTETGASILNVSSALQRYFRYSSDIHEEARVGFGDEQWMTTIKNEIDNNRPVLYYGSGTGAHAFVIDGYDSNGSIHINWGWDGNANGFFFLDALTPGDYDFSQDQGAIIEIHPGNNDATMWSDCFLSDDRIFPQVYPLTEIFVSTNEIVPNEKFDVATPTITFAAGFKGTVSLALVDKNNKIKEIVHKGRNIENFFQEIRGMRGSFIGCVVHNSDIEPGDRLQLVSIDEADTSWKFIKKRNELQPYAYCDNLHGEFTHINWNVNTNLELCIGDEDGNIIYSYHNGEQPKAEFIKGLYFSIRGEGVSSSHGNATAIRVNEELISLSADTYPALIWFQTAEESADIDVLAFLKENSKSIDIINAEPGKLSQQLLGENISDNVEITISGKINMEDLLFIRNNLMFVEKLDLSECDLVSESNDCRINDGIFADLYRLKTLSLPRNTKQVGQYAFAYTNLEFITLPASIENITEYAFVNAYNVAPKAVFIKAPTPPVLSGPVENYFTSPQNAILYVLPGCGETYRNDENWNRFGQILEDPDPLMDNVEVIVNGIKYAIIHDHADISGWDEEAKIQEVIFEESVDYNGKRYPVTGIRRRAMLYNTNVTTQVTQQRDCAISGQ